VYDEEREWQKSKMKRSLLLAEKRDNLRTSVGMNQERKQYRFNSTHPALEGSTSVSCRGVGGEIFTKKKRWERPPYFGIELSVVQFQIQSEIEYKI